jgi:polyisoprenoid-binding protein YceI
MVWAIDASHSQVTFSIKHMGISAVKGHFNVISGQLHIDEQNPNNSWIEAQADVASINTRDSNRDGHLLSADFFDAAKYPTITFKSTKVEPAGSNEYQVTGDLTFHGVTKSVVLHAEYSGTTKDPWGGQRVGISATGKINRKDWGLTFHQILETGNLLVGDEVKFEVDLEGVYAQDAVTA